MNVLIANTQCKFGGVSTFMVSLRRALRALGHTAELFFLERGPMAAQFEHDDTTHFGSLTDLLRLVDRRHFDTVHANNVDWVSGFSAIPRTGARLVLTAHKVREPAWTYGWTTRDCRFFVTVSRWIRDDLQPFTDIPIQVVPNGIDIHRFAPEHEAPSSPPIVAWVGRGGAARKRLEAFAAIAPNLRRAGFRIWVIDSQAPDSLQGTFPDAARTLAACADVWGGASYDRMPQIYRQIAASGGCVVSTASMEGLPLTLLEAQACGCLVIAADVAGVNECVSAVNGGVLYPIEITPEALADFIVDTLRNADSVRERGHAAARHVRESFSLERMAERYVAVYTQPPPPPYGTALGRARARLRLTPFLHQRDYLEQRWGVGDKLLEAARELSKGGHARLAAAAGRASVRAAPTLYLRPGRMATVLRLQVQADHSPHRSGDAVGPPPPVETT